MLVRSPIDGVVVQIFTRQGERVSHYGIAKIVDMRCGCWRRSTSCISTAWFPVPRSRSPSAGSPTVYRQGGAPPMTVTA